MNGVLNLLKPPGMTSQTAVTCVKRILGSHKAGHAGTLDPDAAGVLPVCVGRATKLSRFLMADRKQYISELTLGIRTDTMDSSGRVIERRPAGAVSLGDLRRVLDGLTGPLEQTPPAFSAVKVDGKPLYRHAREGSDVIARPRTVQIYEIELLEGFGDGPFLFRVECSKGTYIRVLMEQIAEGLGQIGCTTCLIRTRVGSFDIRDAWTLPELELAVDTGRTDFLLAPERAAPGEELILPDYLYDILASGARILPERVRGLTVFEGQLYRVFCRGEFFGVGEYDGAGLVLQARVRV